MQTLKNTLTDRKAVWAFMLGCIAVTAGVCAHLQMFTMARTMHYHLAGMPMDSMMLVGMVLIVLGTILAAYGLLPRNIVGYRAPSGE